MSVSALAPERFADAVLSALRAEIERVADEEIDAAHKRIGERVRERVGSIAASVFTHYDLMMDRGDLLIRVRNETKATGQ